MTIREIDDRYPEYALPYEPVKGGRHHKGLGFPTPAVVMAIAGLFIVFWAFSLMGPAAPAPTVPTVDPPVIQPVPPVTDPTPPVTDPTPPVTDPITDPITPPYDPGEPDNPPEDPVDDGPKGPEVSLSAINYWFELYHAEVIYVITANDATDITSSAVVTSSREPGYSFDIPEQSGAGTIRFNDSVVEYMELLSADYWTCDITVSYTLDGESKTETFNLGASPNVAEYLRLYEAGTTASGPTNAKTVTSPLYLYYSSDYRHTFEDTGFWNVTIGWMDSSFNVLYESTDPIWNGPIGSGPFSGPTGPASDSGGMRMDYVYRATGIDVTPPAGVGNAVYFFLEYSFGGDATDTYGGSAYDVRNPESVRCYPQPIADTSYTEPVVTLGDITYWGDFNGDYGLHHIEVDYNIDPKDADAGSITSDVTLQAYFTDTPTPEIQDGKKVSATGISGSGDLIANMNSAGIMFYNSGEQWQPTVTVHYTVGGVPKTTTVTFDYQRPDKHYTLHMSASGDEILNIYVEYPLDDPHEYDISFTSVEIQLFEKDGDYWDMVGSPITLWAYDPSDPDAYVFSDPYYYQYDADSDGTDDTKVMHFETGIFSVVINSLREMTLPAEATHFRLIFHAEGTGKDTRDSEVYTIVGGVNNWGDFDSEYYQLP